MATTEAKKTDRRVVRTRSAIRAAFYDLIKTTDYKKITITSLAHKANIDRKTFYTHYSSIDDLLEDVIRTQMAEVVEPLSVPEIFNDPGIYVKKILVAFGSPLPLSVEERASVMKNLPPNELLRCWISVTKERIRNQTGPLPPASEERIDLLLDFYLGGIFHSYMCWLQSDEKLPIEEVTDLLSEGMATGLGGIMKRRMLVWPSLNA